MIAGTIIGYNRGEHGKAAAESSRGNLLALRI